MRTARAIVIASLLVPVGAALHASPNAHYRTARTYASPDGRGGAAPSRLPQLKLARSTEDQPDSLTGNQTHGVYFVPKGVTDQSLDTNGALSGSIRSIREWFDREMSLKPRLDKLADGTYDITFVRGAENEGTYTSLDQIRAELAAEGLDVASKRYLIYAAIDQGTVCGEGYWPTPLDPPGPGYAVVYLDSAGCGARDFGDGTAASAGKADAIAVQEWLHNEGMVEPAAPHHCALARGHVCTGPLLLAAYAEMAELDPEYIDALFPYATVKLASKELDAGRDDYLDHGLPHLADLRSSAWLCNPGSGNCS